jgi:pyruvate-formate lyase-activating enzyme
MNMSEYQNKKDNTFCHLPWTQIELQTDGTFRACCRQVGKQFHNYRELGVITFPTEDALEKAWNSDSLRHLRRQFLKGIKPAACNNCWKEEEADIASLRINMGHGREALTQEEINNPSPILLDLKLGTHCNLKCRICGPTISSQWTTEAHKETSRQWDYFDKSFVQHDRNDTFINANKEMLEQWLSNIKQICVYGGETFMIPPYYELLDLCVESGHANHIDLIFNTNGTHFNKKAAEQFKHFNMVLMLWSIDDLEHRFHYERHPADFNVMLDNIDKFDAIIDKDVVITKVWTTINLHNVYYLPELVDFYAEHLSEKIELLDFGYVHEPLWFNIKVFPKAVKNIIAEKLLAHPGISVGNHNYATDKSILNTREHFVKVVNFMLSEDLYADHWDDFLEETQRADKFRNENFESVFPELYELIQGDWYQCKQ